VAKVIILVHLHLLQLPKIFMGKFLIGHKKTYDFLLVKKNLTFLLAIGLKLYSVLAILLLRVPLD
jgi:hypothetical protein